MPLKNKLKTNQKSNQELKQKIKQNNQFISKQFTKLNHKNSDDIFFFLQKNKMFVDSKNWLQKYFELVEEKARASALQQVKYFLIFFLLVYIPLSFLFSLASFDILAKNITGVPLQILLSVQGFSPVVDNTIGFSLLVGGKLIVIDSLCTATFEIIILVAAIIATLGITLRKKIWGIVLAIGIGYLLNILRIWVTSNIILTQSIEAVDFFHGFLFKAIMFIYIAGFYIIWLIKSEEKR
jgi:exosortase/archaeosortase family protein